MSRVVATVGAIPGAGATTVVAGLGSALAEQRHHVALVDASAEGSRIANVLSLDGDGTVADALRRRADLAEVQASGPHDLSAFPADPDANWSAIRPGAVASTYETLRDRFEIVLVDCGSEITPASAAWLGYADELLVVTDPDVPGAVQDVAGVGAAFDVPVLGLVANRVVRDELSAARSALAETGEAVLAVLPEDPAVGTAAGERRSLLMEAPDSPIASCLWELGGRLSDGDHATPVVPEPWSDGVDGGARAAASGGPDDASAAASSATGDAGAAESSATEDSSAAGSDATGDAGATESDATDDASGAASPTAGGRSASGGAASGSGSTGGDGETKAAIGSETATTSGSETPSSSESSTAVDVDGSAGSVGATDGSASAGSPSTTTNASSTSASSSSASTGSADADEVQSADDPDASDAAPTDGGGDAFEFSGTDDSGFGVGSGDATDAEPSTTTTSKSETGSGAKAGAGAGTSADAGSGTAAGSETSTGSGTATQTSADVGTDGAGVGGDATSSAATPAPTEPGSASDAGDGRAGGELEDEEATISDDEIEEVFKETMQRVKDEKDAESEDEDDSVLGGFMGD